MADDGTTLHDRIRRARVAAGLSRIELAAQVDLPTAVLTQIEMGVRNVRSHELFDLAEALGTTTGQLLGIS